MLRGQKGFQKLPQCPQDSSFDNGIDLFETLNKFQLMGNLREWVNGLCDDIVAPTTCAYCKRHHQPGSFAMMRCKCGKVSYFVSMEVDDEFIDFSSIRRAPKSECQKQDWVRHRQYCFAGGGDPAVDERARVAQEYLAKCREMLLEEQRDQFLCRPAQDTLVKSSKRHGPKCGDRREPTRERDPQRDDVNPPASEKIVGMCSFRPLGSASCKCASTHGVTIPEGMDYVRLELNDGSVFVFHEQCFTRLSRPRAGPPSSWMGIPVSRTVHIRFDLNGPEQVFTKDNSGVSPTKEFNSTHTTKAPADSTAQLTHSKAERQRARRHKRAVAKKTQEIMKEKMMLREMQDAAWNAGFGKFDRWYFH